MNAQDEDLEESKPFRDWSFAQRVLKRSKSSPEQHISNWRQPPKTDCRPVIRNVNLPLLIQESARLSLQRFFALLSRVYAASLAVPTDTFANSSVTYGPCPLTAAIAKLRGQIRREEGAFVSEIIDLCHRLQLQRSKRSERYVALTVCIRNVMPFPSDIQILIARPSCFLSLSAIYTIQKYVRRCR